MVKVPSILSPVWEVFCSPFFSVSWELDLSRPV